MKAIQAHMVEASNLEVRRISAAENLQREDFSAIEPPRRVKKACVETGSNLYSLI